MICRTEPDSPRATFTFGRQFFETEVLGQVTEGLARLGKVPITVVVDRNQYRGNGWGYQVVRPPSGRLWHAKVVLIMLTDAASGWRHTSWVSGAQISPAAVGKKTMSSFLFEPARTGASPRCSKTSCLIRTGFAPASLPFGATKTRWRQSPVAEGFDCSDRKSTR